MTTTTRAIIDPAPAITTPAGRPVWYPDNAILLTEEVAAVLGCSRRAVERAKIKRVGRGRYLFRHVIEYLEQQAA